MTFAKVQKQRVEIIGKALLGRGSKNSWCLKVEKRQMESENGGLLICIELRRDRGHADQQRFLEAPYQSHHFADVGRRRGLKSMILGDRHAVREELQRA